MHHTILSIGRTLFMLLPCLLVWGCNTTPKEPDPAWRSAELTAPSRAILWDMTVAALERERYPMGTRLDPDSLEAETGWIEERAPFSGDGLRRRAVVRYRPLGSGRWAVDVRVKQQRNMSLRPLDRDYDEWEWVPDDVEKARVLLGRIRGALGTDFELSTPDGAGS